MAEAGRGEGGGGGADGVLTGAETGAVADASTGAGGGTALRMVTTEDTYFSTAASSACFPRSARACLISPPINETTEASFCGPVPWAWPMATAFCSAVATAWTV